MNTRVFFDDKTSTIGSTMSDLVGFAQRLHTVFDAIELHVNSKGVIRFAGARNKTFGSENVRQNDVIFRREFRSGINFSLFLERVRYFFPGVSFQFLTVRASAYNLIVARML